MNISYDKGNHTIYMSRNSDYYNSGTSININELNSKQIVELIDILEDWLELHNN